MSKSKADILRQHRDIPELVDREVNIQEEVDNQTVVAVEAAAVVDTGQEKVGVEVDTRYGDKTEEVTEVVRRDHPT